MFAHYYIKKGIIMKICICDDDLQQCLLLKEMILKHSNHQITIFYSAEEMLFECEQYFPFDCIFLDIKMDKINGITLAKKIRSDDQNVIIVFLSSSRDYVFLGYEVNAMRYLLKPLEEKKCFELLDLIEQTLVKTKPFILINKTKIYCSNILYIESYGHYCSIHTDKTIDLKISIGKLLSQLPDYFVQTHRSYIVNLEHVESIEKKNCFLSNQVVVPISRNSIKKVNLAFMEYIKKGLTLC